MLNVMECIHQNLYSLDLLRLLSNIKRFLNGCILLPNVKEFFLGLQFEVQSKLQVIEEEMTQYLKIQTSRQNEEQYMNQELWHLYLLKPLLNPLHLTISKVFKNLRTQQHLKIHHLNPFSFATTYSTPQSSFLFHLFS